MVGFNLFEAPRLSRTVIDRADDLRKDTDALRTGWLRARVLILDPAGAALHNGSALVLTDALALAPEPVPGAVFLGIRDDQHVWAVRQPELDGDVADLRAVGDRLDAVDVDLMVSAVALLNWHDHSGFSAVDGTPTSPSLSGWSRISEGGHVEFPRTDPAVICLVHDDADHVLLARQPGWPQHRFSVLAGFLEAGESLEACVQREIREEVGLDVRDISYLGSQPWPFPRSVMIGFSAVADPEAPFHFSDGEIAEARWFSRAEVRVALEQGDWSSISDHPLLLPSSISIARGMIASWVGASAPSHEVRA